jgi:3-oxoacyl-[acyl-carrier-protein] synthase-3
MTVYSRIAGTGSYLPEKILTNADLEKIVETSDQWIRERTGIQQRHIAAEGQTTVDLAEQASLRAMEAAGVSAADLPRALRAAALAEVMAATATATPSPPRRENGTPPHTMRRPATAAAAARLQHRLTSLTSSSSPRASPTRSRLL